MIIEIDDSKTIADIQERFNYFFPFLKIEFYTEAHHWYEGAPGRSAINRNKTIGEIRTQHPHGDLELHSWQRTGDLEQEFRKSFRLFAQVFRRQGKEWVQTVSTDKMTLQEQNELGRSSTGK